MIQSRRSRRRVPISRSQSEFACGLCTGVVITLRPRCVSEAFNLAEKILSVVDDEAILVVGRDSFSQLLKRPGGGGMRGGV